MGRDNHGDLVWVGKSNNNEPGKINCEDNDSETPTMHNFWCQGEFMSSKSAFILTIEEKIKEDKEDEEDEEGEMY